MSSLYRFDRFFVIGDKNAIKYNTTFLPWFSTKVSHYDNSICRYATDSKEAPPTHSAEARNHVHAESY